MRIQSGRDKSLRMKREQNDFSVLAIHPLIDCSKVKFSTTYSVSARFVFHHSRSQRIYRNIRSLQGSANHTVDTLDENNSYLQPWIEPALELAFASLLTPNLKGMRWNQAALLGGLRSMQMCRA